tara:strand:- start:1804 stop:2724 length:921 start_codon:yes stop_codon:yes gene_type:complete
MTKQDIDGILIIDKPPEFTSMNVVRAIKRITHAKKAGHVGTLDPLATGVLPICLGQATRFVDYYVDDRKNYLAEIRLGFATDTYDSQGETIHQGKYEHLSIENITKTMLSFEGVILQRPPMFSALKRDGTRLYKLARAGVEIDIPLRSVVVHTITIESWNPPFLNVEISCGKGFYVRSFAHDLGLELGSYAHLSQLRRIKSGIFNIEDTIPLDELEAGNTWNEIIDTPDRGLLQMKSFNVNTLLESKFQNGQALSFLNEPLEAAHLEVRRVYSEERCFLGLAKFDRSTNSWKPEKVLTKPLLSKYA